jgi:peptidyl-prolyl cis-trans isomerase D
MLGIMRKYKQSMIIKIVFSVIVLSFVGTIFLIWGKGEEGLTASGYAIKVNGNKITYDDYVKAYERSKQSLQQIYGQPITPEMEKQLSLQKLTIEKLISMELMRQEAKKQGIKVSDDELVAEISKIPAFQKNGSFDTQTYQQLLKSNRFTPSTFEDAERQDLLLKKLRKTITDKVTVSDQEALLAFKKQHDKINLFFVSFSPAEFQKEVKITDQDLKSFLQSHQKEFKTKEKISVSFLLFPPGKVAPEVSVTAEDLQKYYQKNIDRYQGKNGILPFDEVKEQVKTDTIKFMAAKQAYEKVATALNKNLKTADLNATARMLGVTVQETPLFSEDAPPASLAGEKFFIRKAFAQKQGELAGPIETAKGIYVFKVKSQIPSAVPPLSEIQGEVKKQVIAEKSFDLAHKKAIEIQALLAKGPSGMKMQETGSFQYSDKGAIPRIGTSRELMEAAFLLTSVNTTLPTPVYVNGRWYAVLLKERTEAPVADYQKEREKTMQALLAEKQQEALEKWLKGLKDKAKIVINPALITD